MIAGKRIFVTGGTGFVGSHLVERLLQEGAASVRCLVRSEPRWLETIAAEQVDGDLTDDRFPRNALSDVDIVFHVGALTRSLSMDAFQQANVDGTRLLLERILEEAPGIRHVVLTSSLAVVGRGRNAGDVELGANESTPLEPVSMYGESKRRMEVMAQEYMDRLPMTIVRPPAVYGPREVDILTFFRSVSRGLCPIVGSPDIPAVTLVHVDDLVTGLIQAASTAATKGQTYFVGSDSPVSWGQIRDTTIQALGKRVLTLRIPKALVPLVGALSESWGRVRGTYPALNREKAREIVEACTICDSSAARRDFDYQPGVSLTDGIARTIAWYRAQGWL